MVPVLGFLIEALSAVSAITSRLCSSQTRPVQSYLDRRL
jgi:hypothetical protein